MKTKKPIKKSMNKSTKKLTKKPTKKPSKKPVPTKRCPGRPHLIEQRKSSQVPLFDRERDKLYACATSMGLPYATWARSTLLVVADWPVEKQPAAFRGTSVKPATGETTESFVKRLEEAISAQDRPEDWKEKVTGLVRKLATSSLYGKMVPPPAKEVSLGETGEVVMIGSQHTATGGAVGLGNAVASGGVVVGGEASVPATSSGVVVGREGSIPATVPNPFDGSCPCCDSDRTTDDCTCVEGCPMVAVPPGESFGGPK